MSILNKLKERWGIKSNAEFIIILIVFSINGSLSAYLTKPILGAINITSEKLGWYFYWPLALILILPIYLFLIVIIGTLFGQKKFFIWFAKKTIKGIGLGFLFKEESNEHQEVKDENE